MAGSHRIMLTLVAAGALAGLAAACARAPTVAVPPDAPGLVLERDLVGRLVGTGRFESRIAGVDRAFEVTTDGRWDGRTLTLREAFVFSDGETDTKTWRFRKIGEGRYEGTREDVIGTAQVRTEGRTVRLSYLAELAGEGGRPIRVRFEDVLARTGPDTILNRAIVRRFGLPVGTVEVTFRR